MDMLTIAILSVIAVIVILLINLGKLARREEARWEDLDEADGTHEIRENKKSPEG